MHSPRSSAAPCPRDASTARLTMLPTSSAAGNACGTSHHAGSDVRSPLVTASSAVADRVPIRPAMKFPCQTSCGAIGACMRRHRRMHAGRGQSRDTTFSPRVPLDLLMTRRRQTLPR
jgi:hypothetical protein